MPTYDYECPDGHRFEAFQKMTDEPVAECPECGAQARRLISGGAGFLFKGEGFYITDYRSEDYKKKASSETEAGGKAAPSESSGGKAAPSEGSGGAAGSRSSDPGGASTTSSSGGTSDGTASSGSTDS
ncbi:MAG: FmdB family zinc ribbon protein [Longimicrobiales bacterium]|nr:FmdB family zinc ribbon protein [Longimicrobiales bacterium]